jgi:hypothetical protein
MNVLALGICTNPTSDKGCSIYMGDGWVGDGYRIPADDVIYTEEALRISLQLYNPSACAKHKYTHPAEALQLYSLYSSTALHALQYTSLYNTNTPLASATYPYTDVKYS